MKEYRWQTIVVGVLFLAFQFLLPEKQNILAFAGGMFLSFGVLV